MDKTNSWTLFARHCAGCLLPISFLLTIYFDSGIFTVVPALLFFVGVPLLDPLVGKDHNNLEPQQLPQRQERLLMFGPVLYILLYVASIVAGAWYVSVKQDIFVLVGCIFTMGTVASVGFSASHELIHKKDWWNKLWARVGLLSVAFMHFEIEHLCSHHRYACTEEDTSTGWYGESVYAFLWRSIPKGILFSWNFEKDRLARAGLPALHPRNRVLWYAVLPLCVCICFYIAFGWAGLLLYAAQAIVGSLVLMIVAYIEHYGVLRKSTTNGKVERMDVQHSWDSYYILSGCLTFNVQRHADHHMKATKTYPLLRSHETSIELPAGYQAMIALALVPPWWRKVMHPRLPSA
ncbi:MAG: alkane 1-monooxygenase [Pseudomonadota bacterium]